MTISVIYFNDDKKDSAAVGIRCCADSLISADYGKLTPHAMKILKLNLSFEPFLIFNNKPVINPSLGFTFAGNLNVAMNTYVLLSHLCEHIQPLQGYENTFPSIKNIAILTANILQSFINNYSELNAKNAYAEIILFGYCSQERDFRAFHVYPVTSEKVEIKIEKIKIREMPYFAIGKGKDLLDQKYSEKGYFSPNLVRDIINDPSSEKYGVGGFFQRGWSNRTGITLYCDKINISSESIEAPFCGFNISMINLGTHIVGLPMFAGNE